MNAWVYQDVRQVKKYGKAHASWYVGWYGPNRRRHGKSCGPGAEGRLAAERLRDAIKRDHGGCVYADASSREDNIAAATDDEIQEVAGKSVVYFIEAIGLERVKIGTTGDLVYRTKILQAHCPVRVALLVAIDGGPPVEKVFHSKFAAYRLHGEWFQVTREMRKAILDIKCSEERRKACEENEGRLQENGV